jgi:hypothetical protein
MLDGIYYKASWNYILLQKARPCFGLYLLASMLIFFEGWRTYIFISQATRDGF